MQSLAAVWTTIFPLPAASEPRPGTLLGRSWSRAQCLALVASGMRGHHIPGYVSAPILLGDQVLRGALKGSSCWASARALKELRATSAGRSSSSGRTGHGRQTCGGFAAFGRHGWLRNRKIPAPHWVDLGHPEPIGYAGTTPTLLRPAIAFSSLCPRCALRWPLQILLPDPLAEMDLSSIGEVSPSRAISLFPNIRGGFFMRKTLSFSLALMAAFFATSASAADVTEDLMISATVNNECSLARDPAGRR